MLIAEHFLLISLDPQQGLPAWPRRRSDANSLTAAALLLDLTDQQRLRLSESGLQADPSMPAKHPLLAECLHALGNHTYAPRNAIALLARRLEPLSGRALEGLYRRDLLHRVMRRRWLIFRRIRYPLRSMQARNEGIALLTEAALIQGRHGLLGLALLLLCDVAGILPALLPASAHECAEQQLLALDVLDAHADEAARIVAAIRNAMLE